MRISMVTTGLNLLAHFIFVNSLVKWMKVLQGRNPGVSLSMKIKIIFQNKEDHL